MKSRMAPSSSAEKTDSSWAYMVPSIDEVRVSQVQMCICIYA